MALAARMGLRGRAGEAPAHLRAAIDTLAPALCSEMGSLDSLGVHLQGESVGVLHAPGSAPARATRTPTRTSARARR